ncbi:MAG: hypothetical protein IJ214_08455, partial [Clostridia bacterium]|nr:hypothetical protein [Clostridia bacterium]
MKSAIAMQSGIERRDRTPVITKLILACVFILGIAIIALGYAGMQAYSMSGFSSETGYRAIHALSGDVSAAWSKKLEPQLASLSQEQRDTVTQAARTLLDGAWESQKSGAAADIDGILAASGHAEEMTYKLLYTTYLVNGPKVSTANKKELTGLTGAAADALRQGLLACVADDSAALPDAAVKTVGDLTGKEKQAMLLQAWFVSNDSAASTDQVNTLKKGVRDKAVQLDAFRMIANNDVSWLWQLVVSNSRTAILVGIILALDALLLAFLMMGDKTWILDFKWIIILLIVDFLLLFQLMPLVYMVIKAFFPDSTFSLETFRRLYTYSLNLDALKNTLIAAFATMILGTLLA